MKNHTLIIGTRGSALARAQTEWVAQQLVARHPSLTIETQVIRTQGDKNQTAPFAQIGGKGIFTKEIEQALLDKTVDLAVHSMKDLPTELPEGLVIAAVPQREDAHDVLVTRSGDSVSWRVGEQPQPTNPPTHQPTNSPLTLLKQGAVVGTSSLRRRAQLLRARPDLNVVELRGNVDTRLRKLESQGLDAIVLATAGLKRLGKLGNWEIGKLSHIDSFPNFLISQFPFDVCLPDPGQGALAIECRSDDDETLSLLQSLNHPETFTATQAERAFVCAVEGSCRVPIGAFAEVRDGQLHLRAMIASPDGKECVQDEVTGSAADAESLGRELGERLLRNGGKQILRNVQ